MIKTKALLAVAVLIAIFMMVMNAASRAQPNQFADSSPIAGEDRDGSSPL